MIELLYILLCVLLGMLIMLVISWIARWAHERQWVNHGPHYKTCSHCGCFASIQVGEDGYTYIIENHADHCLRSHRHGKRSRC